MARMLSLSIEKRDMKTSPDALRKTGKIPAIFYGPKEASTPVVVTSVDFKKVWKKAGESSVIILTDAKGAEYEALIHEIDVHPLTGEPRHADFYVIEKGKKVKVEVPLVFEGVSSAVKDKAGILVKVRRVLEIEAAPRELPHDIKVDISALVELTDVILAKNLVLPKGVELKVDPDEVVASIAEAKEEVEEAPAAIDMSAIEVEAKGKEAKEGEPGVAPAGDAKAAGKEGVDAKGADKKGGGGGDKKGGEAKK
jgi:large subunit ribosomal protein L25